MRRKPTSAQKDKKKRVGLSTGEKVAIGLSVTAVVGLALGLVYASYKKKPLGHNHFNPAVVGDPVVYPIVPNSNLNIASNSTTPLAGGGGPGGGSQGSSPTLGPTPMPTPNPEA